MQHSYLKLAMQHIDVNFTYFFVVGKYKYKLHDDVVKNLHLNMIENVKNKRQTLPHHSNMYEFSDASFLYWIFNPPRPVRYIASWNISLPHLCVVRTFACR
jgi:hypothetical protein